MIYKLKNVLSSPSVLRSFAAWFSSKLLPREGQSVSNQSSSIRHSATSPTQSLKRRAKSFSKKMMSSSSTENNVSGTEQKAGESGPLHSAGRSGRLLGAESMDEKARELQEVFAYFDGDGDGKISVGELRGVLKSLGQEMSEEEVRGVMEAADSDGDGFIDLPDFIRLNTQMCKAEEEELLEAFRMLDTEKGGFITPNGLRQLMVRLWGEQTTLHDCVLMIKPFDLDGDGAVSFHEFKRMMAGSR